MLTRLQLQSSVASLCDNYKCITRKMDKISRPSGQDAEYMLGSDSLSIYGAITRLWQRWRPLYSSVSRNVVNQLWERTSPFFIFKSKAIHILSVYQAYIYIHYFLRNEIATRNPEHNPGFHAEYSSESIRWTSEENGRAGAICYTFRKRRLRIAWQRECCLDLYKLL